MSDTLWRGQYLEVHRVPYGDGGHWEYVRRARGIQAVMILAITDQREILLVEQFRAPLQRPCIELPAGLIGDQDADEEAFTTAQRELHEETGYEADQWDDLGVFASSPGMVGEIFHLYRARSLRRTGPGGGVDHEGIIVHVVPIDDISRFLEERRAHGCAIDARILIARALA